jgi:DNA-binding beta-propeller fold protein YncE
VYVANADDDTVAPINIASETLGAPIRVAGVLAHGGPAALAVTPDGRTLYTGNIGDDTVAVISLTG